MGQIYCFEGEKREPPALCERSLKDELKRRRARRQVVLLVLGSALLWLALLFAAILLRPVYPIFSAACGVYLCVTASGYGAIAAVFEGKRRSLSWR